MKQHDLYSIIDYLLNNPEQGVPSVDRGETTTQKPVQKPATDSTSSSFDTTKDNGQTDHGFIDQANPGDYITFGQYEQDNNTSNGSEPREWLVLDKKDNMALIISRYGLDAKAFHAECVDVTWETCDLRKWLNDTFYREAFANDEQMQIAETDTKGDEGVSGSGNDIIDKVFLLSYSEAEQLFESDDARKCSPTEYAKSQGATFLSP